MVVGSGSGLVEEHSFLVRGVSDSCNVGFVVDKHNVCVGFLEALPFPPIFLIPSIITVHQT